ncbi:poly-beta-1,6 N-acetyl-D-glucosamine synthase [Lysobacter arenosi]|uniref:Poly-beta-1,6-N-acetyl-D-glucosamine synthase n=1 Tax=Lysobacter arenosi TaxID=2795387 RepID=A0ABX7R777_9GAMM|nr:poly-beta-1,6-N-acetyl-D-glucosamine synthase [Lysobacter arenosi]QSX73845.1 poly-beta-1,6 N-acetyl-D-glucosamine synthase [Lysobacter arenosi]
MTLSQFGTWLALFCFGYPFVMAFYWMVGGLQFHWFRERNEPPFDEPPLLAEYPLVSILVPCFNEEAQARETFEVLSRVQYPDFEVIAINDGSSDRTGALLEELSMRYERMRVVHLASNHGKSSALNAGALAARGEILVCIDGDTLLDPFAVAWFVRRLQENPLFGGVAGNPRIRNRSTLIGRLQVGEFSNIVGLIKRAQNVYGTLFTVSGCVCAFRKRALQDAGWWNPSSITDDVDVSWRLQLAGWLIGFEPKAMGWILTPETVRGLWRQRVRWAEGGTLVVLRALPHLFQRRTIRIWPIWLNFVASVFWAYAMLTLVVIWLLELTGLWPHFELTGLSLIPREWGFVLAVTYIFQAFMSGTLDRKFEKHMFRAGYWVVWYPLAFWMLQAGAALVGLPRALLRSPQSGGTWVSPDRGFR